jgi:hypothetical protein
MFGGAPSVAVECLDALIVLIRLCDSVRGVCYELATGLMEASPVALTSQQFKHLAEMATMHCFSPNDEVRACAERMLLDLVGHYQPDVVQAQNLTLVRVVPSAALLEGDRLEALFPGDSPTDFVKCLRQSIEILYVQHFGGKRNDHLFVIVSERFKDPALRFPGITDNAAPSLGTLRGEASLTVSRLSMGSDSGSQASSLRLKHTLRKRAGTVSGPPKESTEAVLTPEAVIVAAPNGPARK